MTKEQITQIKEQTQILEKTLLREVGRIWNMKNEEKLDFAGMPGTVQARSEKIVFIRNHPLSESFFALSESIENL